MIFARSHLRLSRLTGRLLPGATVEQVRDLGRVPRVVATGDLAGLI
jgi:hypothetical protein